MGLLKARHLDSGRYPILKGLDFLHPEKNGTVSAGQTIKFYGGTTMGYDHATRGGIRIASTRDNEYAHGLSIEDTITCSKETRKGAFYIYSERAADQAVTSGWGGGEDQLMNLTLRNYANNSGGMGMRGIDLNIRQRDSGVATNMYGCMVTVETDSGTETSGNAYAGRFIVKFNGIHSGAGTQYALEAACESQTADQPTESGLLRLEKHSNSNTLDTKYGLHIDNNAAAKVLTHGIYLSGGITNTLSFDEADGSQGFTAVTNAGAQGNVDGYFKVYDATNAATLYVLCYDTVPS